MSARGIFDLRVWIEADDEAAVWARIAALTADVRRIAPDGVDVRYCQLRRADKTRNFVATMGPAARRKRAA